MSPRPFLCHALPLAALLLAGTAVQAANTNAQPAARLPAYAQECSGCHIAYPPKMLPAESWGRLMAGLPRHFGTDASLDAATVNEITGYLQASAGTGSRVRTAPPEDRITRAAWFVREHDEIPAATWQRAAVRSPANCAACHPRAEQGDFTEHAVRSPR